MTVRVCVCVINPWGLTESFLPMMETRSSATDAAQDSRNHNLPGLDVEWKRSGASGWHLLVYDCPYPNHINLLITWTDIIRCFHWNKKKEEKIEANSQSCPLARGRNLRPRTQRERESKRHEKEESERERRGGGEGVFDHRLKCNCAISFLFQHNEEWD